MTVGLGKERRRKGGKVQVLGGARTQRALGRKEDGLTQAKPALAPTAGRKAKDLAQSIGTAQAKRRTPPAGYASYLAASPKRRGAKTEAEEDDDEAGVRWE